MTDVLPSRTGTVTNPAWIAKAQTLAEALPFMRRYHGATIVIKYGGHAMGQEAEGLDFARDVVLLKQVGMNPVVVHGGAPQINKLLERLQIKSSFVDGLRVTDPETALAIEMALAPVNKAIVSNIQRVGGKAVGLSGKDGRMIVGRKVSRIKRNPESNEHEILDLGLTGEPEKVNPEVLEVFKGTEFIPVITPLGANANGDTLNINGDTATGAIAAALRARRLFMLTDVPGVLDKSKKLLPELTLDQAWRLIADGTVSGGMIPKVENCIHAVAHGVEGAVILDGRIPHVLLLELFTDGGVGTLISRPA